MKKIILFTVVMAFMMEMSCQNGHQSQSWHPTQPKQGKAKRR